MNSPQNQNPAPIRLAILGLNYGALVARRLAASNFPIQVVAVCDGNREKADQIAALYGIPAYYDLDTLLAQGGIDAIGLFTGPHGRAGLIRKILQAGRDVMTTKPFEMDAPAARDVLALAASLGRVLHLNSPSPIPGQDARQIQSWINEFALGQPISLRAETWANYREKASGVWYDDPSLCPVPPLLRLGIYFFNDFVPLMGRPKRVHAIQSRIFTGRPTADNAQVSIEFENGALGNVFASFCFSDGLPYPDRVTLDFEHGSITRWVERSPQDDPLQERAVLELRRPGQPSMQAQKDYGQFAGNYDWIAFHGAVRNLPGFPKVEPGPVLAGVQLLDAVRRSSLSGLPAEIIALPEQ